MAKGGRRAVAPRGAKRLAELGYTTVIEFAAGMQDSIDAGYPVERGRAGADPGLAGVRRPVAAASSASFRRTTTVVSAAPYPSTIAVSGLKGRIRDVNVRLNTLTHTRPQDVAVLLVGPGGQTAIVMARVGGRNDIGNVTLTLDDEAEEQLPIGPGATLLPGAFRPTAASTLIRFNAPAPEENRNTALSIFDGTAPSGTRRLFVQDEAGIADSGVFAGGWTLEITTKLETKKNR